MEASPPPRPAGFWIRAVALALDVVVFALVQISLDRIASAMTGPAVVTARQQVATIAKALGRHVDFVELDLAAMRGAMAGNVPQELIDSMEALSGEDGSPSLRAARILDVVPDLTGRPARTFEEWAVEHIEAFR